MGADNLINLHKWQNGNQFKKCKLLFLIERDTNKIH